MTTFLLTAPARDGIMTAPFCSYECRSPVANGLRLTIWLSELLVDERDDDSYEFDETCFNCGATIKGVDNADQNVLRFHGWDGVPNPVYDLVQPDGSHWTHDGRCRV